MSFRFSECKYKVSQSEPHLAPPDLKLKPGFLWQTDISHWHIWMTMAWCSSTECSTGIKTEHHYNRCLKNSVFWIPCRFVHTAVRLCCWIKANRCCRVSGWVDGKQTWSECCLLWLHLLTHLCTLCVGRTCISFTVVHCVEKLRSQTLFLKDKELFPQGSPPARGSRGFISTDVTLSTSHTKGKRSEQLGTFSAIKHSFRWDKLWQKNRLLIQSENICKICPFFSHHDWPGKKVLELIGMHLSRKMEWSRYMGVSLERRTYFNYFSHIYFKELQIYSICMMYHMKYVHDCRDSQHWK